MIIFGLDGVLSCNEHRQHFIQKPWDECNKCYDLLKAGYQYPNGCEWCGRDPFTWQEDRKSYNEACVDDKPNFHPTRVFQLLQRSPTTDDVYIWTARCESLREKTKQWIDKNIDPALYWNWDKRLKMRPIGDDRPQHELFNEWFNELSSIDTSVTPYKITSIPIEMVFEADTQTIEMFRSRGIFTFDVNQNREN